jgi:ribose transport system substrate-binding protein
MVSTTKPARVLISLITQDNDYQRAHAAGAEAVAQQLGVSLEILYADNDAVTQVQQILTAIQQRDHGFEAIITEPVGTAMLNVAEVAVRSGIAWCLLNRDADYIQTLRQSTSVPVFEVSVDQLQVGHIHSEQIAAMLPGGGTVLYIAGLSSGSTAKLRAEGMMMRKPSNIQVKTINSNWTEDGGYRAIQSWLKLSTSKCSGFAGVVSQNDAMAIGARRAFGEIRDTQERDAWLNLPFLGCDGLPSTGQQYVSRKLLKATVVTPALAGTALHEFMQWRNNGKKLPERLLVGSTSYPVVDALRPRAMGMTK